MSLFVILRGKVRVTTHNDDGSIIEDVVLSQESGNYGVDIPKNVWHIAFYNAERPHSSLDWRTPDQAHRMSGEMKKHWHSWREDAIRREQAMAI